MLVRKKIKHDLSSARLISSLFRTKAPTNSIYYGTKKYHKYSIPPSFSPLLLSSFQYPLLNQNRNKKFQKLQLYSSTSKSRSEVIITPKDLINSETRNALIEIRKSDDTEKRSKMLLANFPNCNEKQATLSLCGYKGRSSSGVVDQINQDRSFILHSSDYLLQGVLDGHGHRGEIVSEHVLQNFSLILESKLVLKRQEIKQALIDSFLQVDATIPNPTSVGGCSASIFLVYKDKIFCANAGDSQSFVVTRSDCDDDKAVTVLYESRMDKPELSDERKRIEDMGGIVYLPKNKQDTSRVLYQSHLGYQSGLAMSRSIGDYDAKSSGVIPTPIVDEIDYSSHKEVFIISATDGLLDYVPNQVMGQYLFDFFDTNENMILAAEELVMSAGMSWQKEFHGAYRDDITIAISKIK